MDKLKEAKDSITGKTFVSSFSYIFNNKFNQAVDQFANKRGVPAGADPEINKVVDDEVNKF
ncbi:hypothetical protein F5Y18DRAFT_422998 [Xylariaceae sp. FL1019]|nr:hypothetical protein F5Y18DRAFT_422998 [Xylariaceae sp. FL1019]